MRRGISKTGLEVGQWVCFSATAEALALASEPQKKIYEENHFFLVISREDAMWDGCRCNLVDKDGNCHDYCPRVCSLGWTNLFVSTEIFVVDQEEVNTLYGKEQRDQIYKNAQEHLEKKRDYFAKYPAQLLYDLPGVTQEKAAVEKRTLSQILEEQAERTHDIAPLLALALLSKEPESLPDDYQGTQNCCMM